MSALLKTARAMDDQRFIWRITAAMLVTAQQKITEKDPLAVRVMANPQAGDIRMVALVATNPAISSAMTITGDVVDTTPVPDDDILWCVGEAWDTINSFDHTGA